MDFKALWRYRQYFLLAVFTALLVFILHSVGFFEIVKNIKDVSLPILSLAVISMGFYHVFLAFGYIMFFKISFKLAILSILSGEFFNTISPGVHMGGEPIKAYFLSKLQHKDFPEQFSAVLSVKLIDFMWYMLFGLLSLFFGALFVDLPGNMVLVVQAVLIIIAFAVLIFVMLKVAFVKNHADYFIRNILRFFRFLFSSMVMPGFSYVNSKINLGPLLSVKNYLHGGLSKVAFATKDFMRHARVSFQRVFTQKKMFFPIFIFTFTGWMFIFLKTYFVFMAFGYEISFLFAALVWMLPSFLGALMLTPGGFGVTETFMIGLMYGVGIPIEISVAVALTDRAVFYLWATGGGYISFWTLKLWKKI